MLYYIKGSDLYSSETAICDSNFTGISEGEYKIYLTKAHQNRVFGEPAENTDEWR